ncbi:MAG: NAD-dependent epimerase/dehydratase family protein [Actinomycetaceae bacterium]|nr:NAD-dependent epimerase/dehydratase family protein [Actinomycetaceae bacterium]
MVKLTVLVTGVAGFIGSSIAAALLSRGKTVIGIDSLSDYYDPQLKRRNLLRLQHPEFHFIHADLNEYDLSNLLEGVDYVFHQAGQPGVRKSWGEEFGTYLSANVSATQRLLEASKGSSIRRFVYASSSSVYGDAETYPTEESFLPRPLSPYGVSKLAAEHLCNLYAANFGVPTVSLRYFTVYGPRQRPDMAFTRFIRAALLSQPIEIYGNGKQVRDFTFIDDVVEANLLAAETDHVGSGSVFNIAGGSSVSVNEVLDLIREISPHQLDVRYTPGLPGDVKRTGGSISSVQDDLNWLPRTTIEDGIRRQFQWGIDQFTREAEGRPTNANDFWG